MDLKIKKNCILEFILEDQYLLLQYLLLLFLFLSLISQFLLNLKKNI